MISLQITDPTNPTNPCAAYACTKEYNPVCASNKVTYSNKCEFEKAKKCSNLPQLTIVKYGKCEGKRSIYLLPLF